MAKCPKCGGELAQQSDGAFICASCGSRFVPKRRREEQQRSYQDGDGYLQNSAGKSYDDRSQNYNENYDRNNYDDNLPASDEEQGGNNSSDIRIRELEARIAQMETERVEEQKRRDRAERKQLEARIATLEAEKYKREHRFDKLKDNVVVDFLKKYWLKLLVPTLVLIAFITLMVTLVGLRGIYVNVNDSYDFMDFTATSYRAGYVDMFTGETSLEEGKWKRKGDVLTLTVEDELFGSMNMSMRFEKLDGFKRIKLDGVEYKRVSLVGIKTTQQNVKVTFDPQNGGKPAVFKMKIGGVFTGEPPENSSKGIFPFAGWYSEPYGKGEQFDLYNSRIWENVTYYAYYKGSELYSIDGSGTITGLNCDPSELPEVIEIPSGVKSIANHVFLGCTQITSVVIPDSVTRIGDNAFYHCRNLRSVNIGNGVTSIGGGAFKGCEKLESVVIGNSLTSIDASAFDGTPWYNDLPNGVVYIGKVLLTYKGSMPRNASIKVREGTVEISAYAFSVCSELTDITIPDSVKSIGQEAFRDCTGLQSVIMGEGVQNIDRHAFYNCTALKDIYYAGDETQWRGIEKGYDWNRYYHSGENYTIDYQVHYNSTGPAGESAEIAEESEAARGAAMAEQGNAPAVWVKKLDLCA